MNTPDSKHATIKSTPTNKGSASRSNYVTNNHPKITSVSPWIKRDVESFQKCGFDTLLKALLKHCIKDSCNSSLDEVFQMSFEAVLGICNEESSKLREYLDHYRQPVGHERDRYPPFIIFANHTLDLLSHLEGLPLHPPAINNERLLFHVSDTKVIKCNHGERKPDVLLVTEKVAEKCQSNQQTATQAPPKPFRWEESRVVCEFKLTRKAIKTVVPTLYGSSPLLEIKSAKSLDQNDKSLSTNLNVPIISESRTSTSRSESMHSQRSATSNVSVTVGEANRTSNSDVMGSENHDQTSSKHTSSNNHPYNTRSVSRQGTTELKQSLEDSDQDFSLEWQMTEEQDGKPCLNVQMALYGAEHLSHLPLSASTLALTIVDSVVYIWYYDRQGAIRSSGLDFIANLPHFVLLLLILQRLSERGWGQIPQLKDPLSMSGQYGEIKFELEKKPLMRSWGIQGRGTTIFGTRAILPKEFPRDLGKQLKADGMVQKQMWGQCKRALESDIINEIPRRLEGLPQEDKDSVIGHIPDLIASKRFEGYQTKDIRIFLGIPFKETENRILIINVFRKQKHIRELEGLEFFRAWWDCVLCHRVLWNLGVRHRDVSMDNLMYYEHDGRIMGVLNDYDLSTLMSPGDIQTTSGTDRTGTLPFMARDLLAPEALEGQVEHLYRHDFESFLWVMAWVAYQYEGGKKVNNPPFDDWELDFRTSERAKYTFLQKVILQKVVPARSSHQFVWKCFGEELAKAISAVEVEMAGTNIPEVDPYFNRIMERLIESQCGLDISVNPLKPHSSAKEEDGTISD